MPHRHDGTVLRVGFASLLMLAVAAGCSHRDTTAQRSSEPVRSSTGSSSLAEWQQELEADCAGVNALHAELAAAAPSTPEEAVVYATQVDRFVGELDRAIAAAGRPSGQEEVAAQLGEAIGELADAAAALRVAAQERDVDAADDAAQRIEERGQRVNELAAQLAVPACGGF